MSTLNTQVTKSGKPQKSDVKRSARHATSEEKSQPSAKERKKRSTDADSISPRKEKKEAGSPRGTGTEPKLKVRSEKQDESSDAGLDVPPLRHAKHASMPANSWNPDVVKDLQQRIKNKKASATAKSSPQAGDIAGTSADTVRSSQAPAYDPPAIPRRGSMPTFSVALPDTVPATPLPRSSQPPKHALPPLPSGTPAQFGPNARPLSTLPSVSEGRPAKSADRNTPSNTKFTKTDKRVLELLTRQDSSKLVIQARASRSAASSSRTQAVRQESGGGSEESVSAKKYFHDLVQKHLDALEKLQIADAMQVLEKGLRDDLDVSSSEFPDALDAAIKTAPASKEQREGLVEAAQQLLAQDSHFGEGEHAFMLQLLVVNMGRVWAGILADDNRKVADDHLKIAANYTTIADHYADLAKKLTD